MPSPSGSWDEDELRELSKKASGMMRKNLPFLALGGLVLIGLFTTYTQVEPDQVGVVTRFGGYHRTMEPGPHLLWPFGIERVVKVPIRRQLKQEFGFRTTRSGVRTEYGDSTRQTEAESIMLTGDLNVADVQWIVQYKIRDPKKYLFQVRNVENTLRDISEAAMRTVVGDRSVNEVLTIGREEIQIAATLQLQNLANRYETGIEITQLVLQDVNPPRPVQDSFNEVNQAIQEKERLKNQALAEYNKIIPEAEGKAKQAIQSAEGYATERVNVSQGDVQKFLALQKEYVKAPKVTRTRLHLETMAKVLPRARRRVVLDAELKNIVPLLGLQQK